MIVGRIYSKRFHQMLWTKLKEQTMKGKKARWKPHLSFGFLLLLLSPCNSLDLNSTMITYNYYWFTRMGNVHTSFNNYLYIYIYIILSQTMISRFKLLKFYKGCVCFIYFLTKTKFLIIKKLFLIKTIHFRFYSKIKNRFFFLTFQ